MFNFIPFYGAYVFDRVVGVVNVESFAHSAVGSNPARDFGFIHVSKLSSQPTDVGGDTNVPLVSEILQEGAPEAFLHKWKLEKSPYDFLCQCN